MLGGELHITAPKTERSHRTITLPAALVPELTRHRKEQSSQRLKLGLGKDRADLDFTNGEGKTIDPTVLSVCFSARSRGRPGAYRLGQGGSCEGVDHA